MEKPNLVSFNHKYMWNRPVLLYFALVLTLCSCTSNSKQKKMGIFDRFKKEKPIPSNEMMNENEFWAIIETNKSKKNDDDASTRNILKHLTSLSSKEIIGFHLRIQKLRFDSYNSELWCAGYILNGGCSDDCFEYFRCWIIAQGEDTYKNALENPDTLSELYSKEIEYYELEDLMYVAYDAFEKKTGKNIDDYIDYDVFKYTEAHLPDFEFNWEEDNEESMSAICPKLMAIAW